MQLALYVLVVALSALTPMDWLQPWLRVLIIAVGTGGVLLIISVLYWLGQRSVDSPVTRGGLLQAAWRLFATILVETGRMQTRMRRHRRAAWGFWVASILNVGMIAGMWWLTLDELGYAISIPTIMLILGIVAILTVVPVSLNGLGIFEGSTVALLGLVAVQPSHSFLLALIVRAAFLAVSVIGLPSAALLWRERHV